MANPEHHAKIKEGIDKWNAWRSANPGEAPDLRDADLVGADLRGADLSGAALSEAALSWADLSRAKLIGADLGGANLARAYVRGAHLIGANLRGANLMDVTLIRAKLSGANLSEATFGLTAFADVDLSTVKGLETAQHRAPSTIGIDTLYRSQGKIPESFLRGCGVPEQFIAYARSLVANPIEFYSCFISYSSKNDAFAQRLHADLQAKALRVWFAPEDLKIGDRFQERIEESIRLYDKVMIILSKASVQSAWVEREVNAAWERERRDNRLVLFPIRIDNTITNATAPWAADLRRQRHIGDFSKWKDHDTYQKAFARLLRDLQAGTTSASA